uniref:Uncharacterized protein n=1 Tax=Tetranychus urticae TaxID=32264 RepID=T1JQL1_TETUR
MNRKSNIHRTTLNAHGTGKFAPNQK